jgi:pyruvate,water dikinase
LREDLGFTNVLVMIPFCRTPQEADLVLDVMAKNGLESGKNGLDIYVMCEVPSNVILAHEFAKRFSGFSIGSNDLTQLTWASIATMNISPASSKSRTRP